MSTLLRGTRYKPDQASLLLNEVRRKFEHQIPTSGNTKGKYLEPTVTSTDPASSRQKGNTSSRIQFLCIPYFHLKHFTTHRFSVTSDIHPIRTLLQIQHPSTSPKRDMQQAVCQLDYTRKRHCFHVPQLWCLMIDNGALNVPLHFRAALLIPRTRVSDYVRSHVQRRNSATSGRSHSRLSS